MKIIKIILLNLLLLFVTQVNAAEIIVTSTANSGTNSFRWAVAQALANDTIIINVKGTINLNSQIDFNQDNVTIIGPYPKHNVFTGSGSISLFKIVGRNNIIFKGIGFKNSNGTLSVIDIQSSVNINFVDCLFENNTNINGPGGCLKVNNSSFIVVNSSFVGNSNSTDGAVIYVGGSNTNNSQISNCTFYNNSTSGNGGTIYFGGSGYTISLANNLFVANNSNFGQALHTVNGMTVNLYNNIFSQNGTGDQITGTSYNSGSGTNGNLIGLNTGETNVPLIQYAGSYTPTSLFLTTTIIEDGYGLKYFRITDNSSLLVNNGFGIVLPFLNKDCRRAPRTIGAQIDIGPVEYTSSIVTNTNSTGTGSLLNAVQGGGFIEFDLSGFNSATDIINLTTSISIATTNVYIDGYSQPGSAISGPDINGSVGVTPAENLIQLTGTGINSGIIVGASNSTISGLNIHGFDQYGISTYSNVVGIEIYGNHIGFSGNAIGSYVVSENKRCGIALGANNSKIGGNQHWQRNVISGNGQTGLTTFNSNIFMYNSIDQVDIIGNFIGLQPDGNSVFSFGTQTQNGIHCWAENVAGNNIQVGDLSFGGKNIISGNRNHGIYFSEMGLSNSINNNIIGLGYGGTTILGNGQNGIKLVSNLNAIFIGLSKGNVISGNTQNGIDIFNSRDTEIQNNIIGLQKNGLSSAPNTVNGITVGGTGSLNNRIGLDTTTFNVISGNGGHGVSLIDGDGTWVLGNRIGTNIDGLAAISNGVSGVNCESAINTKIGGVQLERNIISGNGNSTTNGGIILSSTGNTFIAANYIGTNVNGTSGIPNRQGIITLNSHYANIGGASPNYNVISGNIYDGIEIYSPNTTVDGNIIGLNFDMSNPIANFDNGIDIEVDSVKIGSVGINVIGGNSNNGIYLNNVKACEIDNCFIGTDPTTFSAGLGNQFSGIYILNGQNNRIGLITSNTIVDHLSAGSAGITIDAGVGTLISNNLIGIVSNGNLIANNIGIQLINGANNNLIGDILNVDKNVISGNNLSGVLIEGNLTSNNAVRGNFIGVGLNGATPSSNNIGIEIRNGATDNWIGSDGFSVKRNIISANTTAGIYITGASTGNNIIFKNYIGTDSSNAIGASNNFGVWIKDCATSNYIGADNNVKNSPVICGNQIGIVLDNASTQYVFNSKIGVRNFGNAPLSNVHGIVIQNGSFSNVIGGNNSLQSNIISSNDSIGVAINNCNTNSILGNRIGSNSNGSIALGNLIGVYVNGGTGNVVGTNNVGEGNLITSNSVAGLILDNNPSLVQIQGNYIGVDSGAVTIFLGSGNGVGVLVKNTTNTNVVGGPNVGEGNYFAANGISIGIDNSSDQIVQGNVIGINKAGTSYLGLPNNNIGIYINNSNNTTIGSSGAAGNAIANQDFGIYSIYSNNTAITNNIIGSDLTGQFALLASITQNKGVFLDSATTNSTIGPNNVISGNNIGVEISNTGTTNNFVSSNYIGTDNTGNASINSGDGVLISNKASGNFIGGIYGSEKNVISGNNNLGVKIIGTNTSNNIVTGNLIGLGLDGVTSVPNGGGVSVELNASANIIGGSVPDSVNYICNNTLGGVYFGSSANNNILRGNKVGIRPDLTAVGNINHGILIDNSNGNKIGGINTGDGNEIALNSGDGIAIQNLSTNNIVLGNSIYQNIGLAIDIADDGISLINSGNQNNVELPTILQAYDCGGDNTVDIAIELRNLNTGSDYLIEFYSNSNLNAEDPSGYGEADAFIQRFTYTAINSIDTVSFSIGNYAVSTPLSASLTALNGGGGTSEMSQNYAVTNPPPAINYSVVNETCQGSSDGSVNVNGVEAYYFSVDSDLPRFVSTSDTTFLLSPGTYTINSKYLNGCIVQSSQVINTGPIPTFTTVVSDDTCGLGGIITIDASSNTVGTLGTQPYIDVTSNSLTNVNTFSNLAPGSYQYAIVTGIAGQFCFSDTSTIIINAIDLVANGVLDFVFDDFCANGTGIVSTNPSYGNGNYQFNPAPGDGASIIAATGEVSSAVQGTTYSVEYFYGTCTFTQTPTAISAIDATFDYGPGNSYCYGVEIYPAPLNTGGTFSFVNPPGDGATINAATGLISNETQGSAYDVEYNTGGGCPGKDTVLVTIITLPAAPEITTTDSIYCDLGENVAPLTTNLGVDVEWYDGPPSGGNLLLSQLTYTISLSSLTGGQNTYYYATTTDATGCQSFPDSIGILLIDASILDAGQDVEICTGSEVELIASGGIQYIWQFDETQTDSTVIVSPQIPTTYYVLITDENGCTFNDSINVGILSPSECNIEIYTAFTPNGDGDNDVWIIDGIDGYKENIVYFYNRWGDLVSKIENYDNDQNVWDGTNQFTGQNVSTGTYFYIVEAGGTQARNGWVQIVK